MSANFRPNRTPAVQRHLAIFALGALASIVALAGCGSNISPVSPGQQTTATTTTLSANPTTASSGNVTLTAVVTNSAGASFVQPTGDVNFTVGSVSLGSQALTADPDDSVSSTAILIVPVTSFPNQSATSNVNAVIAQYAGDDYHLLSNSPAVNVTIGSSSTGIATSSTISANPTTLAATANTTLSATVTVTSGSAAPAGTIAFLDKTSGVTLANATLIPNSNANCGSATACSTAAAIVNGTSFASGANTVYAQYQPSGTTFAGSTSPTITVTVSGSASGSTTTTTVSASPASFAFGSCTNLAIQVVAPDQQSGDSNAPTGAVNLEVNGKSLGSATVSGYGGTSNSTYTACSNTGTALGASGSYTLTGTYAGDSNYSTSASSNVPLTVTGNQKALTTLALTISGSSSIKLGSCTNAATTASAMAEPNNEEPTGSVVFYLGGNTQVGTAQLTQGSSGSQATLSICTGAGKAITATGTYSITSTYDGDSNYNAANSNAVSLVVTD